VVALQSLFRQLCFAWITGNGDVHDKNLSIVLTVDGEWRVSPAYDLPSTVPYRDLSFALSLGGRVRGFSRRHLLAFAADVGLPERAATRVLDELLDRTAGLGDELRAGALPFDQNRTADIVAELRTRRRQLTKPWVHRTRPEFCVTANPEFGTCGDTDGRGSHKRGMRVGRRVNGTVRLCLSSSSARSFPSVATTPSTA